MRYRFLAGFVLASFVFSMSAASTAWAQKLAAAEKNAAEKTLQGDDQQKGVVDLSELTHPLQPALWKIEGKGLEATSYLFGTVEDSDPRVTILHPDAEKAFQQATRLYSEIDQNPTQQMVSAMKLMRRDGKTLSAALGPELTNEVRDAILAIDPNYNVHQLQILKTWAASLFIPSISKPGKHRVQPGGATLDKVLYERAKKAGKKLGALESADSQSAVFEQFTEEEQILFVRSSVKLLKKKKEKQKEIEKRIHELYLTNHLAELDASTNNQLEDGDFEDKELAERLTKALKGDRNIRMADKIDGFLEGAPDEVHFFAVGVGHYLGKGSVTEKLLEKGYTVTPVFTPLDPKTEITGYGAPSKMEIANVSKAAKEIRVGETISEIHWGKHLAGPKLQETDKLEGKVVLLVMWGSCPGCTRVTPGLVDLAKELEGKPFHLIASHCQSWGGDTALKKLQEEGWNEQMKNVTVMSRTTFDVPARYVPYYIIFDESGKLIHHNMGGPFHGGDGIEKYRELTRAAVAKTAGKPEEPNEEPGADDSVDFGKIDGFKKLEAAFAKSEKLNRAKFREASPKERFQLMKEDSSIGPFREKIIELIDADPKSEDALEMLAWWSKNSFRLGYSGLIERLVEHHVESELLQGYASRIPVLMKRDAAIANLRTLTSKSPDRQTRGVATFSLYQMLLESKTDDEAKKEIALLRTTLMKDYSNVTDRRGVTVSEHLEKLDFAEKLDIGQPVPEIEGRDLDGVEFKLSEYRGKVVVLSFWGDW